MNEIRRILALACLFVAAVLAVLGGATLWHECFDPSLISEFVQLDRCSRIFLSFAVPFVALVAAGALIFPKKGQ